MVRLFAAAALGAMTIFTLATSTTYAHADRASLAITIQVQGQPNVDPRALFHARSDLTRLYRRAGIELSWGSADDQFVIVLGGEREASAMGVHQGVMGLALIRRSSQRGRVAHVYYDRVQVQAEMAGFESGDILGYVIAHEIAHLLGVSHAASGLMRAGWNDIDVTLAARGLLDFSPEQREIMHQGVVALTAE